MAKLRMGARFRETMRIPKSSGQQQQQDLQQLLVHKQRYREIDTDIEALIMALCAHQKSLLQVQKTRMDVAACLAKLSKHTPLESIVGSLEISSPSNTTSTTSSNNSHISTSSSSSYVQAHSVASDKTKAKIETFHPSIQGYASEWQKTYQKRIQKDLQFTNRRRFDYEHYRRKTTRLRRSIRHAASRGSSTPPSLQQKLARNEQKYQSSADAYQRAKEDLHIVFDEATQRYWRDLVPLIVPIIQLELKLGQVETQTMQRNLPNVLDKLDQLASKYHIPNETRLAEWAHSNPVVLCTRSEPCSSPIQPSRIEEEEEIEHPTAVPVSSSSDDDDDESSSKKLKDPNDPNRLREDEIVVSPLPTTNLLRKLPKNTTTTTTHNLVPHSGRTDNPTLTPSQRQPQSYMPRYKDQAQTVIWNSNRTIEGHPEDEQPPRTIPITATPLPVATPVDMDLDDVSHNVANHTRR